MFDFSNYPFFEFSISGLFDRFFDFLSIWASISRFLDFLTFKYLDLLTSGIFNSSIFHFSIFHLFDFPNFWIDCSNFPSFAFTIFRLFDFSIFRHFDFSTSRFFDVWILIPTFRFLDSLHFRFLDYPIFLRR